MSTEVVSDREIRPSLYLRDEQIEKYLGEGFKGLKIGEEKDVTIRVKVTGLSERKEEEYDDKGAPTGKEKIHKTLDLEIVGKEGKTESNVEKALKNLGRTGPKV